MEPQSMKADEPPLLGALLRVCWEGVRARIRRDLASEGFDDIGASHLAVFQHPTPRGMRVTALGRRAGVSRQAISYLLDELERKGYIERGPDPSDRRATVVDLTERGEAAIRTIRASVHRLEREWESKLGVPRFAQFRETLALAAALDDEPDR